MASASVDSFRKSCSPNILRSRARSMWYSLSLADPRAICKNRQISLFARLSRTLRNVRTDRSGGTPQLTCQSVELFPRECASHPVNFEGHVVRPSPNDKLFIILHDGSSSVSFYSQLIAHYSQLQKLFTKFFPGICLTLPLSSSSKRAAKISEEESSDSSFSTI